MYIHFLYGFGLIRQYIFISTKQNNKMSQWNNQDRLLEGMKHKYMKNVLDFNREQIQLRQKRKIRQQEQFQKNVHLSNQEALSILLHQSDRNLRKKANQKNVLKEYYDRQIQERERKAKAQKLQEREYFLKEIQHRQYEQSRRVMQLARMFNRKTYQARPVGNQHRRIKTEVYEPTYLNNPERYVRAEQKNLQNIEIIKPNSPIYQQRPPQTTAMKQRDSLDTFNHSFKQSQRTNRY